MWKDVKRLLFMIVSLGIFLFMNHGVQAAVSGACADCHTMHNSQNGTTVWGTSPQRALTKGDCVGCHTGTNAGGNIPYVLDTSAPTYGSFGTSGNTLAGGNFYWVQTDDAKGHNVVGIAGQDAAIGYTPPGWDTTFNAHGQVANGTATWSSQLTCAGAYGCHGKHVDNLGNPITDDFEAIRGAHHGNDDPDGNGVVDGDGLGNYTVATSFRFLYGIKGKEDSDWEYQPTSTAHNEYYAGSDPTVADNESINYLCAECHGLFHSTNADDSTPGSPWLRHPTELDLGDASGSGYTNYPGPFSNTTGTYIPEVPVGSTVVTSVLSSVTFGSGQAIVLCISCHRAHGSPYDDLLRWDYTTCTTGGSSNSTTTCGCFACHTTK